MEALAQLLSKYKHKGALIDTNLLLVYFVGLYDPRLISRFKRTATFTVEDFELLAQFVAFFSRVITTPNILTEVNSLSNQLAENIRRGYFSKFADRISTLDEHYLASSEIAALPAFDRFGLTDLGIVQLVRDQYLVLSDDLKLIIHLQQNGIDAINFNHIRAAGWN